MEPVVGSRSSRSSEYIVDTQPYLTSTLPYCTVPSVGCIPPTNIMYSYLTIAYCTSRRIFFSSLFLFLPRSVQLCPAQGPGLKRWSFFSLRTPTGGPTLYEGPVSTVLFSAEGAWGLVAGPPSASHLWLARDGHFGVCMRLCTTGNLLLWYSTVVHPSVCLNRDFIVLGRHEEMGSIRVPWWQVQIQVQHGMFLTTYLPEEVHGPRAIMQCLFKPSSITITIIITRWTGMREVLCHCHPTNPFMHKRPVPRYIPITA
jgi:hypothetical protein